MCSPTGYTLNEWAEEKNPFKQQLELENQASSLFLFPIALSSYLEICFECVLYTYVVCTLSPFARNAEWHGGISLAIASCAYTVHTMCVSVAEQKKSG